MNANEELLVAIHKNAEMGKTSLEKLAEKCENHNLQELISRHHDEYKRIYLAADTLLKDCEGNDAGVPAAARMMSNMMLDLAAMKDHSTANFADMMLKGTDKGIEEIEEAIEKYGCTVKPEVLNLAKTLRSFLLQNKSELVSLTKN